MMTLLLELACMSRSCWFSMVSWIDTLAAEAQLDAHGTSAHR
jgi:hypothetical protein